MVLALVSTMMACTTSQPQEQAREEKHSGPYKVGDKLTASFVRADGSGFDTQALAGKPYFLNLWATWCGPCVAEMPALEEAATALAGQDVRFVLGSDEPMARIDKFREKYSYAHLELVQVQETMAEFGVMALPTSYLVDAEGTIVKVYMGAQHWDKPEMIKELSEAIQ